jgi:Holliday junction resolvase RusA-like endonuclease
VLTSLSFVVDGPPVPKQRARRGAGGRFYTPPKTRAYEARVKLLALQARQIAVVKSGIAWPLDAQYELVLVARWPDRRRRDISNVLKSIEDACNTVLWNDDSQIARVTMQGYVDPGRPAVEVRVSAAYSVKKRSR